jgi:hypothetical protein
MFTEIMIILMISSLPVPINFLFDCPFCLEMKHYRTVVSFLGT